MSQVWLLLSRILCLVNEGLDVRERMAWTVEIKSLVVLSVEPVKKGEPRTRKNLRLGGRSKVTLRSLKDDIMWFEGWSVLFSPVEMVKSGVKVW